MWHHTVAILYQEKSHPFPLIPPLLFIWRPAKIQTFSCLDPKMFLTPLVPASILLQRQMLKLICPLRGPLGPKVVQLTCSFGCLKNSYAIQYTSFFFLNLLPLGQHSASGSFPESVGEAVERTSLTSGSLKQALSFSDVRSKLLSLLSWEEKWIFPIKSVQVSCCIFPGV